MNPTNVFFICCFGNQGSGKSTVCQMIHEQFPGRSVIISMSTPIKKLINTVFGISIEDMEDTLTKNTKYVLPSMPTFTIRNMMQYVGTCLRKINVNIFIELFQKALTNEKDKYIILVPDLRYQNEMEFFRSYNSIFVRVDNDLPSDDPHESEIDWKNFSPSTVIKNSGSKDDLYKEIRSLIFPNIPKDVLAKEIPGWKLVAEKDITTDGDFVLDMIDLS